jgi:aminoglycoside 6'-N-acetyltransferase
MNSRCGPMPERRALCLREATPEDCALLRYWDTLPHVIASDPNDDWEWETELCKFPPWREQLMAEVDGRPIGFMQIIDPALEDSHYWGDIPAGMRAMDLWIGEPDFLGQGHGSTMMMLGIDRCFAVASVTAIVIDPLASNVRAHRFYQRLGFVPIGLRHFGQDECLVHELRRQTWATCRSSLFEGVV